jgi:CRP-like cAMP-binding protein
MAMFLQLMEQMRTSSRGSVAVPMSTSDIAEYVELAPETVARTLADLERQGVIRREARNAYRVANRSLFETLAASRHP